MYIGLIGGLVLARDDIGGQLDVPDFLGSSIEPPDILDNSLGHNGDVRVIIIVASQASSVYIVILG